MKISKEVMNLIQKNIKNIMRIELEVSMSNVKVTLELTTGFTNIDYIKMMSILDNDLTEVTGTIWLNNEDMCILDFMPNSEEISECITMLECIPNTHLHNKMDKFLETLIIIARK